MKYLHRPVPTDGRAPRHDSEHAPLITSNYRGRGKFGTCTYKIDSLNPATNPGCAAPLVSRARKKTLATLVHLHVTSYVLCVSYHLEYFNASGDVLVW